MYAYSPVLVQRVTDIRLYGCLTTMLRRFVVTSVAEDFVFSRSQGLAGPCNYRTRISHEYLELRMLLRGLTKRNDVVAN